MLRMFGIGVSAAIAGKETEGTITRVDTCYWFKGNTKPIRRFSGDGAIYPHIIHFTYTVGSQQYTGKRFVHWNRRCPVKGEKLTVYYEPEAPGRYAILL